MIQALQLVTKATTSDVFLAHLARRIYINACVSFISLLLLSLCAFEIEMADHSAFRFDDNMGNAPPGVSGWPAAPFHEAGWSVGQQTIGWRLQRRSRRQRRRQQKDKNSNSGSQTTRRRCEVGTVQDIGTLLSNARYWLTKCKRRISDCQLRSLATQTANFEELPCSRRSVYVYGLHEG